MRIANLTDSYMPKLDGISVSVSGFSRRLSNRHNVRVYAADYGRLEDGMEGKVEVKRYESISVPNYKELYLAVPNIVDIYRSVKEFKPDVIHVHSPGPLGLAGLMIGKRIGVPVVGTYHTLLSEFGEYWSIKRLWRKWMDEAMDKFGEGEMRRAFFSLLKKLREEKGEQKTTGKVFERMVWFAVNQFYNQCDLIIVPSLSIKRELEKRKIKKPIRVVSSGVDVKKFEPKKEYDQNWRVVHAGRLSFEKEVDVVVGAFGQMAVRHPEARLIIAGDGPARKNLEKQVGEAGLKGRVEFLGMVDRKRIDSIYKQGEIFVTASPMETQGLVLLEAMACGLPVVGVDAYAIPDLVENGKNGYVVKVRSKGEMAKAMEKLLDSKKLRENMGRAARATVTDHDVEKTTKLLERVYVELADGFKARASSARERQENGVSGMVGQEF